MERVGIEPDSCSYGGGGRNKPSVTASREIGGATCPPCGSRKSRRACADPRDFRPLRKFRLRFFFHRQREAGIPLAQGRSGRAGSLVEDGGRSFVLKNVSPSHGACGRRAATAPFRQGGPLRWLPSRRKTPRGLCPRGVAKPSPRTGKVASADLLRGG